MNPTAHTPRGDLHAALGLIESRAAALQVLVVGDVMLDRYVHGQVRRLSPEAPIPVLNYSRTSHNPGGAANVAANVAALGAQVHLLGVVGADIAAQDLAASLSGFAGLHAHMVQDAQRPTTEKTRYTTGGHQLLRVDREETEPIGSRAAADLVVLAAQLMRAGTVVILPDYAKGVLSAQTCQALISHARNLELTVLVDPKGSHYGKYAGASLVTPNLAEISLAVGGCVVGDEAVVQAANALRRQHQLASVLVTRSADGMTLVDDTHPQGLHVRSAAQEVSDVSGAGDTVIAAMGVALGCGIESAHAALVANVAAGASVARHGAVQVALCDIMNFLR